MMLIGMHYIWSHESDRLQCVLEPTQKLSACEPRIGNCEPQIPSATPGRGLGISRLAESSDCRGSPRSFGLEGGGPAHARLCHAQHERQQKQQHGRHRPHRHSVPGGIKGGRQQVRTFQYSPDLL
eukprot:6205921-Pleurochrysis_carterae.AAC.1